MSANEPLHDPVDLFDELDSIVRAQELLRQRTLALQARYRALEPYADRFDKPSESYPRSCVEYGSINIKYTVSGLGTAAGDMAATLKYALAHPLELAEKIREYPQPERDQADRPRADRGRSR